MTIERVTVSLPGEIRQRAQQLADDAGVPFSTVVAEALTIWTRGALVDAWLVDYEAEHGSFSEEELGAIAQKMGVPYVALNATQAVA
jgi:predicted transcriptional regulator